MSYKGNKYSNIDLKFSNNQFLFKVSNTIAGAVIKVVDMADMETLTM